MHSLWAVIPITRIIQLEEVVRNLFILAEAINDTTLVLEGIQVGLSSLPKVVMAERIALDFLLTGQEGFVQSL